MIAEKLDFQTYLKNLQTEIIQAFEQFEPTHRFELKPWQHPEKGGGRMGILKGEVFEKAAVHFSAVEGEKIPFSTKDSDPFFATGLSLITHMKNPHAPTVHMNVRFIQTQDRFWFGGGYDLTPMGVFYEEDKSHFHQVAQKALDPIDPSLYPKFSQQAKEYFWIKHRNKERGVGGLFFDHYNSGNFDKDLALVKSVANSFLPAILPLYEKRVSTPYTEEQVKEQLRLRGHYAEFNLVYDRGTKFGLESNGNIEAILSSLPPLASW